MPKGNKKKANAKKPKTAEKKLKTNITLRKKKQKSWNKNKTFDNPFPSRYGSHASMVSEWVRPLDTSLVICEDEKGLYVTDKNRLDSGIADSRRWCLKDFRDGVYDSVEKVVDPTKRKKETEKSE